MREKIEKKINHLLEKLKETTYFSQIEFIFLYGSALTDYHLEDQSDIDICIFINLKDKEELTSIRLALLKQLPDKYDIQMYQLLPLYVQIEVIKGEVIYVRDKLVLYERVYQTIDEYEDFYPYYSEYINR